MENSPRLGLPLLFAGQLQKEIWHNEALMLIDGLIGGQLSEDPPSIEAPANARPGLWYRIDAPATGDWSDHDGELACLSDAGWRFIRPFAGLELRGSESGVTHRYFDGEWSEGVERALELRIAGERVVGARQPQITEATGGSVVDIEARSALASVLAALRSHGLIEA